MHFILSAYVTFRKNRAEEQPSEELSHAKCVLNIHENCISKSDTCQSPLD